MRTMDERQWVVTADTGDWVTWTDPDEHLRDGWGWDERANELDYDLDDPNYEWNDPDMDELAQMSVDGLF